MLYLFRLVSLFGLGWCLGVTIQALVATHGWMAAIATLGIPVLIVRMNIEVNRSRANHLEA